MKSIPILALSTCGLSFALLLPQPATASAMNGAHLQNGAIPSTGIAINGAGQGGLSLEGVILPGRDEQHSRDAAGRPTTAEVGGQMA